MVREPIKKTSIVKKRLIIEKGFELMCNKGYHNISCVDIAKYAKVSTGIIYQYFNDKREIFLEGVKDYSDKILYPMLNILDKETITSDNLRNVIEQLIDQFINVHTMKKSSHEELMAMSHLDDEIKELFHQKEMILTDKIVNLLIKNNFKIDNVVEKVHIVIGLVDNLCHEIVYHQHKEINYTLMKKFVIETIILIFNKA